MTLAQKWDFSLYDYMFEIWSLSLSLDVPWCEMWYLNLFGSKFGKYKLLGWRCRKKMILVYMVAKLIDENVEIVPWFKTWYVNIFCFVFGQMKVLSRK